MSGGMITVIWVSEVSITSAATSPIETNTVELLSPKLFPWITNWLPPAAGPDVGEMESTVGTNAKNIRTQKHSRRYKLYTWIADSYSRYIASLPTHNNIHQVIFSCSQR
jgi:hypothetical protein